MDRRHNKQQHTQSHETSIVTSTLDLKQSSFLIKKIATKKRQWPNPNIQRPIKIKRLETQLSSLIDSDLCCFQADVFQTRRFSNTQKYLSSIRKNPSIPSIIKLNETIAESREDRANLFDPFFQGVFTKKNNQ